MRLIRSSQRATLLLFSGAIAEHLHVVYSTRRHWLFGRSIGEQSTPAADYHAVDLCSQCSPVVWDEAGVEN